jgi:probable F420-dependent oxidoreductase
VDAEFPFLDPWIALTNIAAHTTSLLLATGVTVVPLYRPGMLAKQAASLDRVSGGRLLLGVGVGHLAAEFDALGVSLETRGQATDEALDVALALWRDSAREASYLGRTISGVRAEPRPATNGGPPLVIGGHSPASFRRAVRLGHEWYGFDLDPAATRAMMEGLRRAADEVERPSALPPLGVTVTPTRRATVDADLVEQYRELGVSRLVLHVPVRREQDLTTAIEFVEATPARVRSST